MAFRETASKRAPFSYTHKKQSGGSGQYGKVEGYLEPLDADRIGAPGVEFVNHMVRMRVAAVAAAAAPWSLLSSQSRSNQRPTSLVRWSPGYIRSHTPSPLMPRVSRPLSLSLSLRVQMGNNIPPDFLGAIEKGFMEAMGVGPLCGSPVMGVRVVLEDGAAHAVDSNEMSFKLAAIGGFRQAMKSAGAIVLEPVMNVEVSVPSEFQGAAIGQVSQRKGTVNSLEGAEYTTIHADVPLSSMFGYSSDLRSATQGKGEFSMEYKMHAAVTRDLQEELMKKYEESRGKKEDD